MKNKTAAANGEIIMVQVAMTKDGKFQTTCQFWAGGDFYIDRAGSIEKSINKTVDRFLKGEKIMY